MQVPVTPSKELCHQHGCFLGRPAGGSPASMQIIGWHLQHSSCKGLLLQDKQPGAEPLPHRGDRSGGRRFHARLLGMMDCRGGSFSLQAQLLQACPSYSCQVLQTPKWCPRIGSRSVHMCWALWCIQACCYMRGCGLASCKHGQLEQETASSIRPQEAQGASRKRIPIACCR